jgi:hypothetical protein
MGDEKIGFEDDQIVRATDRYGISKFGVNAALSASICLPILLQLTNSFHYMDAFVLSSAVVFVISLACSFFWSRVILRRGILSHKTHTNKSSGLKKSGRKCFYDLWIIPCRSPLPVSDTLWALSLKRYGQTVKAGLAASTDTNYFVVGAMSFIGLYVGFAADFGAVLSRLVSATGATETIQSLLVALSALVSTIYLFNGFFRVFLLKGNK